MGDKLIMSQMERNRKVILEGVISHRMTLREAASRMEVGYRQARRILKRYLSEGDSGLVHRSRGMPSSNRKPAEFKQQVIQLYKEKYRGFGPTLASEFMEEEDGIKINPETLRLWIKQAGLWIRQRKHRVYRQRRERRERFGELLQIDGSDHHWFGDEHPRCCLLNMVDDATGQTMAMLDTGETTHVLLTVLKKWIQRYGLPQSVYVDLKSVYISCSDESLSVFQSVCKKLDIQVIKAYSPQAKGRVERKHGVFQDRFVKELKLRGITDINDANKLLDKKVLNRFNEKFVIAASDEVDGHRDAKPLGDLNQIICWEVERQVQNDYTVRFENNYYQIQKESRNVVHPKNKVHIRRHLSGQLTFWSEGKQLRYKRLSARLEVEKPKKVLGGSNSANGRKGKSRSPWNGNMMQRGGVFRI